MKRGSLFCFLSAAMALGGCSSDSHETAGPTSNDAGGHPSMDGGPVTDGGRTSTGSTELPCEVEEALGSVCRDCHGDPPQFGAPMSLMTWEDTQQPAVTDDSKAVHELIGERINSSTDPMPPQGFDLTPEHKAALDAWVAEGAPQAADGGTCAPTDGGVDPDGGTTLPEVGPEHLPCTPEHEFKAHADGNPDDEYTVPFPGDEGNTYTCFAFDAPFEEGEQGTAWAPVVDNDRALHHMILWESPETYTHGDVFPCGALPDSNSKFLTGWAPGGTNTEMPADVGLQLDPDSTLILQVHYFNTAEEQPQLDESGFAMCTDSGRAEEAGVIAVGPMDLDIKARDETTEEVTCPGEITHALGGFNILASSPHMHQLGSRFKTEIVRNEGEPDESTELLTEVDPWSFDDQTSYPQDPPVQVNEGDGIRVTCTYDNDGTTDVSWGENTQQEMCFDFLLVYPVPDIQPVVDCAESYGLSFPYDGMLVCQEDIANYASLLCDYCGDLCE